MSSPNADPERANPTSLPSGTVTFVFTDIEGSTQRWDGNRIAMQAAVRRHDTILRAAIAAHDGYVFKTVGDAFCAAFARPEAAVHAMLAAQRALVAEDFSAVDGLRVRAAIHTGTADERDSDYFGPPVNRTARLLAIAHGGQTLVSGVTSELVAGSLAAPASLLDLGEHRLKDLARPEHVYALQSPELPATFPPLRSLAALPNNLPRHRTSFIGRDTEIAQITERLAEHQLVTLVGSGGIGKTRTSLHVAANLLDGSGDGVWFVELAPLANGDYLPSTVAHALGITLSAEGDAIEQLARALAAKRALLIFDNCEHLIEAAALVIATILRRCPAIKILASSRQALGITGEVTYRMPSLALPLMAGIVPLSAQNIARFAAPALFFDRAQAVDPRFSLTDDNAATIAEICRRLDGIPLAIELAAARINVLAPRQLRDRLDERFRVLTRGNRDVLPRQQTLRALIDWSHDLLDDRERTVFRRLAIFVANFTVDGAAAVAAGDDFDEFDVFEILASLVDKSLVLAEPADDAMVYRLLESTRAYAREKLVAADEYAACAARHLRQLNAWFGETSAEYSRTGRRAGMLKLFASHLDDIRAALDFALTSSERHIGGELFLATSQHFSLWQSLGLDAEGLARSYDYLAVMSGNDRVLCGLWCSVAYLSQYAGHSVRAFESATKALTHGRASGDAALIALALTRYAWSTAQLGRFAEADATLREAETTPGLAKGQRLAAASLRAHLTSAQLHTSADDLEAAAHLYAELRREHHAIGNAAEERLALLNLAEVRHAQHRTREAAELITKALPAFREQTDRTHYALAVGNLAGYRMAIDQPDAGLDAGREALREYAATAPDAPLAASVVEHMALGFALTRDVATGAMLAGYAQAAIERGGFGREYSETVTHDRITALLGAQIEAAQLTRLLSAGAALEPEAALALALGQRP